MILYYSPGACSLADHIALHEAKLDFDLCRVDLKSHTTEDGRDFLRINPKGYVPALEFDDGELLTENIAILSWVADLAPQLAPAGKMGRYRLLETLAFISTEIHKGFKPFFAPDATDEAKAQAASQIEKRLDLIAEQLDGGYLLDRKLTVADCYLFVMLTWAQKTELKIPRGLQDFLRNISERPAVREALRHEGLDRGQAAANQPPPGHAGEGARAH